MSTKIEWTITIGPDGTVHPGYTFNPWSGCTKISAGCANCYAAALPPNMRRGATWGPGADRVFASERYWAEPLAWARKAARLGVRLKVFCASTADVFEDRADLDAHRERLFRLIADTPELDWLLLTKRPHVAAAWWGRMQAKAAEDGVEVWWPANAWIGTSVESQDAANTRIPHLLTIPARVRFLSCEPLLGLVDLTMAKDWPGILDAEGASYFNALRGSTFWPNGDHGANIGRIHWVIVGGESGRNARPMHPDWARSLREQCADARVPFFFKQWGEWAPGNGGPGGDLYDRDRSKIESGMFTYNDHFTGGGPNPFRQTMDRIGKLAAGRLLDGVEHSAFPVAA